MTLIVFEGPEASGKSSIIKMYTKLGIPEIKLKKAVQSKDSSIEEINKVVDETTAELIKCVIDEKVWMVDRFFISNQVYNDVFKRGHKDFLVPMSQYRNKLLIVFCDATDKILLERYTKRDKVTNYFAPHYYEIIKKFRESYKLAKNMGFRVIKIDTSD